MTHIQFTVTTAELVALGATAENLEFMEESDVSELDTFLDTITFTSDTIFDFFGGFTISFNGPDEWDGLDELLEAQWREDLKNFIECY